VKRILAAIASAIALVALPVDAEITYGQLLGYGLAAIATREAPGQMAVGGQVNGWNHAPCPSGPCWTFGLATEAIGYPGSGGYLIGLENMIGNMEPANLARKVANNAVIHCAVVLPCRTPNNHDSIAYWVSADPGTGFDSALKLDRNSIADSTARNAAVLDLGDLDPSKDFVFVRLPGGREVRFSEFTRVLNAVK
jgi:hypothetical protein